MFEDSMAHLQKYFKEGVILIKEQSEDNKIFIETF